MGLGQVWAMYTGEFQDEQEDWAEFQGEEINDAYEQGRLKDIYEQQKVGDV